MAMNGNYSKFYFIYECTTVLEYNWTKFDFDHYYTLLAGRIDIVMKHNTT